MSFNTTYSITGFTDQHGRRIFRVSQGDAVAWLELAEAIDPPKAAARLAVYNIGIVAGRDRTDLAQRVSAINAAGDFPPIHLVDQLGWHLGRFQLGSGSQVIADGQEPLPMTIQPHPQKWGQRGTLIGWKLGVARPLTGQPIPMFLLMLAFVAPLIEIVRPWTNPGFELVGPGGTGKTSMLLLVASVFGGLGTDGGGRYWETWNATIVGLENILADHADSLLILDELNAFSGGASASLKQKAYNDVIFQLSSGLQKIKEGRQRPQQRRVAYLSSSNTSLVAELAGGDATVIRAAADRLLTVNSDAGAGYGVFASLPKGVTDSADLVAALLEAASDNHGVAFPAFIEALVDEVASDRDGLKIKLQARMDRFKKRASTGTGTGSFNRTLDLFALVYAAGRLAQSYGVLPKKWDCGPAVLACFHQHVTAKTIQLGAPLEQIRAYAASADIVDLRQDQDAEITPEKFHLSGGVIIGKKHHDELLVHPPAFERRITDASGLVRRLRDADIAVCEPMSLQTKRRIGDGLERVYCFKLPKAKSAK